MTAVLAVFLAIWLVMRSAPATPIARRLRRWLVEAPAARLSRVRPGQVAVATLLALVIGAAFWFRAGDGLGALSMATPDAVALLSSLELSAYLDVAIAAVAAWSALRVRDGWSVLRWRLGTRPGRRPRHRTARRRTIRPPASNDDGEPRPDRRAA